jgi:hypothetical protein
MAESHTLSVDEIIALIAPSVGQEKAREAVEGAVRTVGTARPDAVLELLALDTGVLGAAARYAKLRAARLSGSTRSAAPVSSRPRPQPTVSAAEIQGLLAPSLGEDKSREVVMAALHRRGFPAEGIDYARAIDVLDTLAQETGIVGVTARFAKARLILLFQK